MRASTSSTEQLCVQYEQLLKYEAGFARLAVQFNYEFVYSFVFYKKTFVKIRLDRMEGKIMGNNFKIYAILIRYKIR